MDTTINDLVNEALGAWIAITGVQTGPEFRGNLRDLDLRSATEEVAESRQYDPSGVTTFMLLRAQVDRYVRQRTFTALDLLTDPGKVAANLAPVRQLRDLLDRPEAMNVVARFRAQVRDAAVSYGVRDLRLVEALLATPSDLGLVRRDALRSIVTLEAHQFAQGDADAVELKLNPEVFQFWSVPSFLWALRGQHEPGITLALIRSPADPMQSFFCFGVRNGGTITLLTDRDKGPHPAYARMSRRPDRRLDERAERHRFPYELLDVTRGEDDRLRVEASTALVSPEAKGVPLKRIADLAADALVWTVLMVDLIREVYGVENRQLKQLSFTADRIVEVAQLPVEGSTALATARREGTLHLLPIAPADLTAESTAEQWRSPVTGHNRWMVERYGAMVPADVLLPVGQAGQEALLLSVGASLDLLDRENFSRRTGRIDGPLMRDRGPDAEGDAAFEAMQRAQMEVPAFRAPVALPRAALVAEVVPKLDVVDPAWFGPAKDLVRDREWTARVNQMRVIQAHAVEEFERTKVEVMAWYRKAVRGNQAMLLDAAYRGELLLTTHHPSRFSLRQEELGPEFTVENAVRQAAGDSFYACFPPGIVLWDGDSAVLHRYDPQGYPLCAVDPPKRAGILTLLSPTCPEALAVLAGCKVDELPPVLRRWYKEHPYYGNNILSRLDPEDWVLKNPWAELKLRVGIALCRSAYNAGRAKLGLPRKAWTETGEARA